MKFLRKIILLMAIVGLSLPTYTTEREAVDRASCRTTSKGWDKMTSLFPNLSLDEITVQFNSVVGNIDTPHLPTPIPSTGSLTGDLVLATSQVDPTLGVTLGQAINNVYTLLLPPIGPLALLTVVTNINTTLGAGGPNADTTGKVNFIFNLIGGADLTAGTNSLMLRLGSIGTANVRATAIQNLIAVNLLPTIQPPLPINYPAYPYVPLNIFSDLQLSISQVNPTAFITLGGAVTAEVTLIGVIQLPPTFPIPIPYPYLSSGIIDTDLRKAIGQVDSTFGIHLGQAITNNVNRVGISSTHIPTPVIPNPNLPPVPPFIFDVQPPNRDSSGIIVNDLNTFNSMLNAGPAGSVGATYQALMDRFANFFLNGGTPNTIPAGTTIPPTLSGIMTALGI